MPKIEDLRTRPEFDSELQSVARAVAVAIAAVQPSPANAQGSVDIEVSLSALMLVAAGLIAADLNLKARRDVRLQAEAFGGMLRDMAIADRDAGDSGELQFLQMLGAGLSPASTTDVVN